MSDTQSVPVSETEGAMETPFDKPRGLWERLIFPVARVAYRDGYRAGNAGQRSSTQREPFSDDGNSYAFRIDDPEAFERHQQLLDAYPKHAFDGVSHCVGQPYPTKAEAAVARTLESVAYSEKHHALAHFSLWQCFDGHYHYG